jgi:hypothetical protein
MVGLVEKLSELWEMLQDAFPDLLRTWPTPALQQMRLGPPDSPDNQLMVRLCDHGHASESMHGLRS